VRFAISFLNFIIYSSNAAVCRRPTFSAAGRDAPRAGTDADL
jgi:hypothetical protein